jgi:hypothetical protein
MIRGFLAALALVACASMAQAQTKPAVTGLGPDYPIGGYHFDENNNVVFGKRDRLFDAAVMMDCSQCPIHPKLKSVFTDYAKKDADIVRRHGARPVFFMSWAYADRPEMTAQLAEAYTVAGNANDALVIPAGLAFARARAEQPELKLYAPGKRHPSLAGTYLAACTTSAAPAARRSAIPIRRGSTSRPRNSCSRSPGIPCRSIIGNNDRALVFSAQGQSI